MKTLLRNSDNLSMYIFGDDDSVVLDTNSVTISDWVITDLNNTNSTLVENVTPPSDYARCKYTYSDGVWTVIPGYSHPEDPVTEWMEE